MLTITAILLGVFPQPETIRALPGAPRILQASAIRKGQKLHVNLSIENYNPSAIWWITYKFGPGKWWQAHAGKERLLKKGVNKISYSWSIPSYSFYKGRLRVKAHASCNVRTRVIREVKVLGETNEN